MRQGRSSWTAELMALFRAIESSRPADERLFDDPYAAAFLSFTFRGVLLACRVPGGRAAVVGVIERRWGGPLGAAVCRTRYIDDALGTALAEGVEQVVILGAGFDSRAYRIPGIDRVRVFEVDHPATQATKQAAMRRLLGVLPEHVAFVSVDFDRERVDDAMAARGFRTGAHTFFLWEGVTNYLTAEAVDATLRFITSAASSGSRLLFTYIHRGMLDGSLAFEGACAGSATVRRIGEPYTFGLDPGELPAYLAARGLRLIEDVAASEYRARYLRPRGRDMKIWEFYRAVLARLS